MLSELDTEQTKLLETTRDKWLNLFFHNLGKPVDREKAREGIEWLYRLSGLKKPKEVIFVSSPYGAQLVANALNKEQVGEQIWEQVRKQVGEQVWEQVRKQVGEQVGEQIWEQVRKQVGEQVAEQVWWKFGREVWEQVRKQVADQVRKQVQDQVGDQVAEQVQDQFGEQVVNSRLKYYPFGEYGGVGDFCWVSRYDFFTKIGILDHEDLNRLMDLLESRVFNTIQLKDVVIVSEYPTRISRDERNKLHDTGGPAIEWADSYSQYYLWGVSLSAGQHKRITSGEMTAKEILALENMEHRMVALKLYNPEKLFQEIDAELLDTHVRETWTQEDTLKDIEYKLYKVTNIFPATEYFVNYTCPSTGRFYSSCVEWDELEEPTAEAAMAWKQSRTLAEYRSLEVES